MSDYYIGAAADELVNLSTVVPRDPQPAPAHYAEYITLGDGTTRGTGWLMAEWRWQHINTTELAALRTYCSAVDAVVYIITPDIDGTFTPYSARMIWPQIPEPNVSVWFEDFDIQFINMVEIPGTDTGTTT